MSMHCTPCLEANHKGCRIMLPIEWEDENGRCICKCADRDTSRLTNVERMVELKAPKKKMGRRPGTATKWTTDAIKELCRLEREEGLTSRQIGARVGADPTTVRTYLFRARKQGWR